MLDSFKFLDEDDHENDIFPLLCPRAREQTSFWRENVIAIVTLLRVLARMS